MKKILAFASIIFILSCESNEEQIISNGSPIPNGSGKFLAQVTPAKNSVISFWEVEPGLLMIAMDGDSREDFSNVDVEKITNESSVVELYKELAKGKINNDYLSALQEAQLRKENSDVNENVFDKVAPEALAEANKKLANESSRTALTPRTNCQPDHGGDAYGDFWFVSLFTPPAYTHVGTNDYEKKSAIIESKGIRVVGMAADYAATATFAIYRMNSSLTQWVSMYSTTLQPRTWSQRVLISESKKWYRFDVIGQAPCPRVHWVYQKI
jgi:hypothetical protein